MPFDRLPRALRIRLGRRVGTEPDVTCAVSALDLDPEVSVDFDGDTLAMLRGHQARCPSCQQRAAALGGRQQTLQAAYVATGELAVISTVVGIKQAGRADIGAFEHQAAD